MCASSAAEPASPTGYSTSLPVPSGGHDVPWYYDAAWHDRAAAAKLISSTSLFAACPTWAFLPKTRRYRELSPTERSRFGEELGLLIGNALGSAAVDPAIICTEKPYLPGLLRGLQDSAAVPFVLVAVNGGDAPLAAEMQAQISELPLLRACYAMNLETVPFCGDRIFPLPIGLPHHADKAARCKLRSAGDAESLLADISASSLPWEERDARLLIAPMQLSRLRKQYLEVLSEDEYSDLVVIVQGRLSFEDFLALLSKHRSVLSPPGKGYDCFRTWQALAVGTVPLVVEDDRYDQRLFHGSGARFIPKPHELSREILQSLLSSLAAPSEAARERLTVKYWYDRWCEDLGTQPS